MTLVDTAALVRKRERRDGRVKVIGLTGRRKGAYWLLWRIGDDGPQRETEDRAIAAANGRIGNRPDHKTVLSGEIVTADDVRELHAATLRALTSGRLICRDHYTPLGPDESCGECIRDQVREDR